MQKCFCPWRRGGAKGGGNTYGILLIVSRFLKAPDLQCHLLELSEKDNFSEIPRFAKLKCVKQQSFGHCTSG